jgi:excisionase family DNA binding protein
MSTYLTVQEVADRLGVSVFTIRRYIRAGKLRAIKLDGAYRLSRDDLAEFLKSREIGGQALALGALEPSPPAQRDQDGKLAPTPSSAPMQTQ